MGDLQGIYLTVFAIVMKAVALFQKPDIDDSESVRSWVRKSLAVAGDIAGLTPNTTDDLLVVAVINTVDDDVRWADFYAAIHEALGAEGADPELLRSDPRLVLYTEDAQLDPTVIVFIIEAIMEALKWWRDRRNS